jgi:hypothetical protein
MIKHICCYAIFVLFLSGAAHGGGDSWAVKITAVTQNEEETVIMLKAFQSNFSPLAATCNEVTIHVKLRGQKWLADPTLAKLENWLFQRNMFLLNPIPVRLTLDAIERLKKASLTGEKIDFGILSGKGEGQPCHYWMRGIFVHYPKQGIQGITIEHSPLQVIATYHYL